MVQDRILAFLNAEPANIYYLAYSAGLDSHVLLHACAAVQAQAPKSFHFQALHIHHGLQASADAWVQHAERVCAALQLPLKLIYLNLKPATGESIEAVARQARYQALSAYLGRDDLLLTAHHQDDQAETFLLNALRGSGGMGLAAMPAVRALGLGKLGRPLLTCSRAQLEAYAQQYQLQAVQDPSNEQTQFDRNYLRHEIMPRLRNRWPAVAQTLSRAATWQAEQQQVLDDLLAEQLAQVKGGQPTTLSVAALMTQTVAMQKALIRHWLQQLGFAAPSAKKLQHILTDVLAAALDANPCVAWFGCELRRYRDDLYALEPLSPHDNQQSIVWADLEQDLVLTTLKRCLSSQSLPPRFKLMAANSQQPVTVRFRQGGERVQGTQGSHLALKTLFQAAGIPSWERERIPLIYLGDELQVVFGVYPKEV